MNNTFNRQWNWLLCAEPLAYWQTSAPASTPTTENPRLVSRLVTAEYWQRQCDLYFPAEVGGDGVVYAYNASGAGGVDSVNRYTGGWESRKTRRLLYVNGENDPWRSAGVSSEFRPADAAAGGDGRANSEVNDGGSEGWNGGSEGWNGERGGGGGSEGWGGDGNSATPILLIPHGFHCSDLSLRNAAANKGVRDVVGREIEILRGWVAGFYKGRERGIGEGDGRG